jgi:ribonuclease D
MDFPQHQFIEDAHSWSSCIEKLIHEPRIAIDLEANSLYAYREQVCLIQISIPDKDYIIDPIADFKFNELREILLNPSIEKIFHAAEYDLILLKRQFHWELVNLFDTMWAARILGLPRCGLANLLSDFYGVKHNKKHQKANWCRRPLSQDQLTYAQIDTHYLLQLRNDLSNKLAQVGRLQEANEIFAEQTKITLPTNSFDPQSFWRINGVRDLSGRGRAIAKALNLFRNRQARKMDRPPFKVFQDRTLMEVAKVAPGSIDEFDGIHGMSVGQVRRYGKSIITVIAEAQNGPIPERRKPTTPRPPEAVSNRYDQLHNWRKQRAKARGVESDVIISRDALWTLAKNNPKTLKDLEKINILGPWRLQAYGDEIITLLDAL